MLFKETEFEKSKREMDSKYYLRFFYWNPDDKRAIVPGRYNLGFGELNFGHPRTWIFILIVVALMILSAIYL